MLDNMTRRHNGPALATQTNIVEDCRRLSLRTVASVSENLKLENLPILPVSRDIILNMLEYGSSGGSALKDLDINVNRDERYFFRDVSLGFWRV
jgi:hypothetical protein